MQFGLLKVPKNDVTRRVGVKQTLLIARLWRAKMPTRLFPRLMSLKIDSLSASKRVFSFRIGILKPQSLWTFVQYGCYDRMFQ